jgi:hypothetical protein
VALAHSQVNAEKKIGFSQNYEIGFLKVDRIWLKPWRSVLLFPLQLKQEEI